MEIRVDPKQVALAFLAVAAVLTVINGVLLFFHFYLGDDELFGLIDFFDFDIEGNIPTLYSAVSDLFCSALLALITHANWRRPEGQRVYWLGLTILFFLLAVDEGTAIHEQVSTFLERYMDAHGALFFLWVIPYGVLTGVVALTYIKFLLSLPPRTRMLFAAAGAIFVTGALGVEMLGAKEADLHGYDTVTYCVLYSLEEVLEMLGINLFIYALLRHMAEEMPRLSLIFVPADDARSARESSDR